MKQPNAAILPTHTPALFDAAVACAAECLRRGEVIALPTETVYGLAGNALDARAVRRIFEIKGRPAHNPIIVHVCDRTMVKRCVAEWPPAAENLATAFWPGPLTLVLDRSRDIPDEVTAGGSTVGIRWPSHPFMQAVIRACGFPLAAPSANLSNQLSPTTAAHVRKGLAEKIPLIVDGGPSQHGIESTVIDVSVSPAQLLRPGTIHEESLVAVLGQLRVGSSGEPLLRSPGLLRKHYAPRAKLAVISWRDEADLKSLLLNFKTPLRHVFIIAHTRIPLGSDFPHVSVIPHDAEAYARALYSELHRCDEHGAELIIVEAVPKSAEWRAIADRLRRAAA